ncbi:hypothetical protein PsorP6_017719 [Peronosclerospora sorghi]|uniref:Uncharacterized protein n=1 Tax=Peronosclerospora sorghi TaxID=230839 RepID=A0ACC0WND5_9STRA|nr:hypothetical protein PsorP6_017719 [Peronosclerospora sorghi]
MDIIAVSRKSTVVELGYTDKDVRNFLQRTSTACSHQDAVDMLSALKARKDKDGEFHYEFTQDGEGRLEHIFWMEGASRRATLVHGDVIVLDTTYKLNRYKIPLAIFVGVNQHGQIIPCGCALIRNEKRVSFMWLLETWKKAMGRDPDTIFTDQDEWMSEAIDAILPTTRHHYCVWYLLRKFPSWFASILGLRFHQFMQGFWDTLPSTQHGIRSCMGADHLQTQSQWQ